MWEASVCSSPFINCSHYAVLFCEQWPDVWVWLWGRSFNERQCVFPLTWFVGRPEEVRREASPALNLRADCMASVSLVLFTWRSVCISAHFLPTHMVTSGSCRRPQEAENGQITKCLWGILRITVAMQKVFQPSVFVRLELVQELKLQIDTMLNLFCCF